MFVFGAHVERAVRALEFHGYVGWWGFVKSVNSRHGWQTNFEAVPAIGGKMEHKKARLLHGAGLFDIPDTFDGTRRSRRCHFGLESKIISAAQGQENQGEAHTWHMSIELL
jgi:hypothetical protein